MCLVPVSISISISIRSGITISINLTISASFDDGRTWPLARLIHKGPAAYSDLAVLPNGEVLCFYEGGKKFRYESMLLARFNLAWLKKPPALKAGSPKSRNRSRGAGGRTGAANRQAKTRLRTSRITPARWHQGGGGGNSRPSMRAGALSHA